MGRDPAPRPSRRILFVDERGEGLRASWRAEASLVVLSLWRGDVCTGTFRMTPRDAARLAQFLTGHLEAPADETVALPTT